MTPDPNGPAQNPSGPAAATQPTSTWARSKQIGQQVAADLPEGTSVFGAAKAGWQAGRAEAAANQSAPTHFGFVQDASTHGTWDNGNGGVEPASAESLDALHAKVDDLQGSVAGMASSGSAPAQNQNLQSLTPSRMPERPAQVSPLAASAEQRTNALNSMQQAGQQLQATRDATSARFAARQAACCGVPRRAHQRGRPGRQRLAAV